MDYLPIAVSHDDLLAWLRANQGYAALVVFALGFAESIVLLALLVPSSLLLAGIGTSYAAAGGSLMHLWLAGAIGATLGDAVSFALGRYLRDDLPAAWPFRRYPGLLRRGHAIFHRWGWFALIASKFTFGVRPFVPVTAGIVAMRIDAFLLVSTISCVLWAGAALGVGYAVARAFAAIFSA